MTTYNRRIAGWACHFDKSRLAIKRIAARYQQRTGQEIFGQLFGTFCKQFNTPRYALLSARRYQEALEWINDQARTLLPDDPEAALPLQESMR